jgi:hypothetical protein
MVEATPIRVLAAGGFDDMEMNTHQDTVGHCTDDGQTPCVPHDREHPWILLDLGGQKDEILAVELFLMPPKSPSPPPSPLPPPYPLPNIPPPQSPPHPSPSPHSPYETPTQDFVDNVDGCGTPNDICEDGGTSVVNGVTMNQDNAGCSYGDDKTDCGARPPSSNQNRPSIACNENKDSCIINLVSHSSNGICEDGAMSTVFGVINYENQLCAYGSDETDCGTRPCNPVNRMLAEAENKVSEIGWVEVYVSRQLAHFGTRCATLNTSGTENMRFALRCTDGTSNAQGRYVYLRSFESARMLRIDGIKVYLKSSPRRLDNDDQESSASTPHKKATEDDSIKYNSKTKTENNEGVADDSRAEMKRLGEIMYNLTKTVCNKRSVDPATALQLRHDAAMLWGELDNSTSNTSCYDCVTLTNKSCVLWFINGFGLRNEIGARAEQTRKLKEQLKEQEPERRRKIQDALDKSCCRRNKLTKEVDCKKEYCIHLFNQNAQSRMGHILRRMHEKGVVDMSVEQRVAVDIISPHLHPEKKCRRPDPHTNRIDKDVSDVECIASSLIQHISDKHGLSKDTINDELGKYGLSIAKLIAQPFQVASTLSETASNFKSSPVFADIAAKLRSKQRENENSNHKQNNRRTSLRAHSLKSARVEKEETSNGGQQLTHSNRDTVKKSLALRKSTHTWLKNVSQFVSTMQRKANLVKAYGLMPQVHQYTDESYLESSKSAISAIVSADGSVINTAVKSVRSLGTIVSNGYDIATKLSVTDVDSKNSKSRKLSSSRVSLFYDEVERRFAHHNTFSGEDTYRRLSVQDAGLTLPDDHVRNNGWIANMVDWKDLVKQTHEAADTLVKRRDFILTNVESKGTLPSGPFQKEYLTGISILDLNAPPTKFGNMLRRVHAWLQNEFISETRSNTMEQSRRAPRVGLNNEHDNTIYKTVAGSVVDAMIVGTNPLDAARIILERSNSHHASHSRKLAETFVGQAMSVPILPIPVKNKYSSYDETQGGVDYFKEIIRYVVYDAFLCYLYSPDNNAPTEKFDDGTYIKTHRTRRMCVPMVPFAPAKMKTFKEFYQLGNVNFDNLEFEKACNSDAVKSILGALGNDWAKNVLTTAPMGALLRIAEGIDSIRNLATSGLDGVNTEVERGAAIVCGVSQLGGLLFSIVTVIFTLSICICAPCGSAIALYIYRSFTMTDEAIKKRNLKIDDIIKNTDAQNSYVQVDIDNADNDYETKPLFEKQKR